MSENNALTELEDCDQFEEPTTEFASGTPKLDEQDIKGIIAWLKSQIADIDVKAQASKADKIIEAARMLSEKGMKERRISQELAHHAKEIGIARSWLYQVLPDRYKSRNRVVFQSLSPAPDLGARKIAKRSHYHNSVRYTVLDDGEREYQPLVNLLVRMMNTAKKGICKDCICINCRKLRVIDFSCIN